MLFQQRRLSTLVLPSLRAARRSQRLLRDLDPGSVTVPSRLLIGFSVSVSTFSDAVADAKQTLVVRVCSKAGLINPSILGTKLPRSAERRTKKRLKYTIRKNTKSW